MKNMVAASVRGRVGDDITQRQDDEGSVRNCSNYTLLYFWNKFPAQIPWKSHFKSGKSSVLHARNKSFVRRGFRRKVPFFLSSTKLSEVVQGIAFDALAPDSSIHKYFHSFLKSCQLSICVFNCRGIVFLTNPTVCLKSVFRPKKNFFSWVSSQVLHKFTPVVGKVFAI